MKELYTALLEAKKTFPKIIKNKTNPHFKNRYADLDTILEAIEPSLHRNGLFITQSISGNTLKTRIIHASSGQVLESADGYPLPEGLDSQKFGGAITYARRYDLCSMLSITAEDDDDGAKAVGHTSTPTNGYVKKQYGNSIPN
jgi:hypothetical protein